jgi:5-methylcytosine-specific restriction endonuclease McrA
MSTRKDGSWRYDGFWRKVRPRVLERDGYRCQIRGPGCRGEATEVDHIVDVGLGGALYDETNCRSVCGPCHRRRSNQRRQEFGRRRPSREW